MPTQTLAYPLNKYGIPTFAPKRNATTEHLESLSTAIFQLLNTRDFTDPIVAHIAPKSIVAHENGQVFNETDILQHFKGMIAAYPDLRIEVLNTSAWVNHAAGTATVWIHTTLSGLPEGWRKESIGIHEWERRDGVWLCLSHSGLRYVAGC